MSDLGTLSMILTAKTGMFTAGMAKANMALGAFTKATAVARGAAFKLMAVLGPVIGVGGLAMMTRSALASIDATAKLADRLGTTTEAFKGLGHAAELAGVGSQMFNTSMEILVRRMGEAKQGTGEMLRAVKTMGLDLEKLTQQDPSETFVELADQIAKMPTAAQKASAAYQLFGRSGMKLVNMLNEGTEGLRAQMEEARRLGITFDRVDAKKVEMANDAMTRVTAVFTGMSQVLAIQLAPMIEVVARKFTDWAQSGEGFGTKVIWVFEKVAMAVAYIGDAIHLLRFGVALAERGFIGFGEIAVRAARWVADAFGFSTESLDKAVEYMDEVAKKSNDKITEYTKMKMPSDNLKRFFDDVRRESNKMRADMEKNAQAALEKARMMREAEAFATALEGVDALTKKVQEQIDTFGMAAEEIEIWRLHQQGASLAAEYQGEYNDRLKETVALMGQLKQKQQQAQIDSEALKAYENWEKERSSWLQSEVESLKQPLDIFKEYRDKLETYIWEGLLDPAQYQELVRKKWEEMGLDGGGERRDAQFRTFNTRLVDLKSLSIGQDPVVSEVKKSNEHLSGISNTLRLLLDSQAPLS